MDISHYQRYRLFIALLGFGAKFSAKAVDAEGAPSSGEIGGCDLSNM